MPLSDEQHQRLQTLLEGLEPELKNVYPGGRKFVEDQLNRFAQYGQDMFVSPKQLAWLESLYKEHCSEAEAGDPPDGDENLDMDDDIPF